jgi:hypothetical protein
MGREWKWKQSEMKGNKGKQNEIKLKGSTYSKL